MSMRTKWKPPARHLVTASRPFMAVCHRTLSRFMNASSSLRLIMLSSTIRTLIGGTAPSSKPAGSDGWSALFLIFLLSLLLTCGRGDATGCGGGGVETLRSGCSKEAGGLGRGGGIGAPFIGFETSGRLGLTLGLTKSRVTSAIPLLAILGTDVRIVGEDVCWRPYLGR